MYFCICFTSLMIYSANRGVQPGKSKPTKTEPNRNRENDLIL